MRPRSAAVLTESVSAVIPAAPAFAATTPDEVFVWAAGVASERAQATVAAMARAQSRLAGMRGMEGGMEDGVGSTVS
jgi:hypothetical protein